MTYKSPTDVNFTQGFGEVASYMNEVTYSWYWNMFLIAIYVITLMIFGGKTNNWLGAFAVSGFLTFTVGLMFFLGGAISGVTFAIVIAFMLLGAFALFMGKG